MTYLWQEVYGQPYYRVQTDDKVIAQILKRRKGFIPSGTKVLNKDIWIFNCKFTRPDIAKKIVTSVTGVKPQIDSDEIIFFDPLYMSVKNKISHSRVQKSPEPTLFCYGKELAPSSNPDIIVPSLFLEPNKWKV